MCIRDRVKGELTEALLTDRAGVIQRSTEVETLARYASDRLSCRSVEHLDTGDVFGG